ncbi:MAG: hypothetical protein NWE76_07455, partial [Candidatus Bathyarchaeota archaeon]|nr:hypothetical protein [Candidatus Bathyarchaeota archaeon]
FPSENPSPDFDAFRQVLLGEREPSKVHFFELGIDYEVMSFISERLMGKKMPSQQGVVERKSRLFNEGKDVPALAKEEKPYLRRLIEFYYRMGYDCVPTWIPLAPFSVKSRVTDDTAILSRGRRTWVEERAGVITSWDEFEAFPWHRINLELQDYFSFISEVLPEGMKATVGSTVYEMIGERLLGWECMFRNLFLNRDLVKAVFDRWGQIVYNAYKEAVTYDCVGAIFHADDLGYKKGTMVNPDTLREIVFPWFKKFSSLAHEHGKLYLCHCCGNVAKVMEDLIEEVKIDGLHAFQDNILPVWEFKERYGDRVAALGGVDVDKLARYDREALKRHVKRILEKCAEKGRYALGSGNTVTNHVPVENYLTMLEEGLKWKPK